MSTHTPGPWAVSIDDTGGNFSGWPSVQAAPERDVSVVHRAGFKQEFWGDLSQRECLANARLIAAAPDLLTALQRLERASTNVGQHLVYNAPTGEISSAIQGARAAIAKAEGAA